jgi:hypothetical protein
MTFQNAENFTVFCRGLSRRWFGEGGSLIPPQYYSCQGLAAGIGSVPHIIVSVDGRSVNL